MIAKTGSISYAEIGKMDIFEFFLIVTNLERQNTENKQHGRL